MTDRARQLNTAITEWRKGCSEGLAGECPKCNAAFLRAIDQLIKGATAENSDAFVTTTNQVGHA
jgi:hypothetical protein